MERVFFGRPFVEVVLEEVARLDARRVFLLVSNTLNNKTSEIRKLQDALGDKFAALYDDIPAHIPRDAVLKAAAVARESKADLIVTVGGGSVTDAGKNVQLCLEHNITELDQFEPFRLKTDPETGAIDAPVFRASNRRSDHAVRRRIPSERWFERPGEKSQAEYPQPVHDSQDCHLRPGPESAYAR